MFYKNVFSNIILAILDSVQQKLKTFGKTNGQQKVNKTKGKEHGFFTNLTKN